MGRLSQGVNAVPSGAQNTPNVVFTSWTLMDNVACMAGVMTPVVRSGYTMVVVAARVKSSFFLSLPPPVAKLHLLIKKGKELKKGGLKKVIMVGVRKGFI